MDNMPDLTYIGTLLLACSYLTLVQCSGSSVAKGCIRGVVRIYRSVGARIEKENLGNVVVREEWKGELKPCD